MKRHIKLQTIISLLTLLFAISGAAFGQEETAATVTGQVTDSTGSIIKGATVVITNDTTQQERRLQTNDDGQFVITPLVPGTYTLTVEQANFKKHIESSINLNAKDRRLINVVL